MPKCPKCGSEMQHQVARRGKYAGQPFWGCVRYPACKGIINIKDDATQKNKPSQARTKTLEDNAKDVPNNIRQHFVFSLILSSVIVVGYLIYMLTKLNYSTLGNFIGMATTIGTGIAILIYALILYGVLMLLNLATSPIFKIGIDKKSNGITDYYPFHMIIVIMAFGSNAIILLLISLGAS